MAQTATPETVFVSPEERQFLDAVRHLPRDRQMLLLAGMKAQALAADIKRYLAETAQ